MGSSGLGSTSTGLTADAAAASSGGGGGRSRGDFHMVLRKLVPAGAQVKKGDVIAEFDRQYMMTRLDDYLAAVAQSESSYRKGTADLSIALEAHRQAVRAAKGTLEKARLDLKAAPVLSAIQAEKLKLAVEEAEAEYAQLVAETEYLLVSQKSQIRSAEIEVRQSQVELDRARENLDKLIIRTPIDGMVVRLDVFFGGELRQAREGDEVWSGMPFVK
ncbi:MAG: hypothetical protein GY953_25815, partial [bacterium]|nr:hypothetical protein [bacterium]